MVISFKKKLAVSFLSASLALCSTSIYYPTSALTTAATPAARTDVVMSALTKELNRSFNTLKKAASEPLYYMSYRLYDVTTLEIEGSYGAIEGDNDRRYRVLDVEMRVGTPKIDNTHKLRSEPMLFSMMMPESVNVPVEDNEEALRTALWLETDRAYREALKGIVSVKADKDVRAPEEDDSDDFSIGGKSQEYVGPVIECNIDRELWKDRIRNCSKVFKEYPDVTGSSVQLSMNNIRRYIVNSEGTKIEDSSLQLRVFAQAQAIAEDGMVVSLYDSVEAQSPKELPDEATLKTMLKKLCDQVVLLKKAPLSEPYAGPAILRNKAAGVFFHEVLGHRIEGHRQKDEEEGRTFANKVNKGVVPKFISVMDDPTMSTMKGKWLNGFYKYDDEGVPAERVSIIDKGILKNFLMSRSPIAQFKKSNGHGRCSPGRSPVARQGNLIVDSTKRVPYPKLKSMLISEAKKQKKPYGLIIDEIEGGFAITQNYMPQSFSLIPLRVTRVWANGQPEEILRGVGMVGTPLASIERILSAGDDDATFNGQCGAESGWVPVSATSPSLLIQTIELEKPYKEQEKPPLLPAPLYDKKSAKSEGEKK